MNSSEAAPHYAVCFIKSEIQMLEKKGSKQGVEDSKEGREVEGDNKGETTVCTHHHFHESSFLFFEHFVGFLLF